MNLRQRLGLAATSVLLTVGCSSTVSTTPVDKDSSGTSSAAAATAAALAEVGPFRVSLENRDSPATGLGSAGQVSWESSWRLSWPPVPGATSYAISYGTNEGSGEAPPTTQTATFVSVQVAAGTSPRDRLDKDRKAGVLFTSSQLLVSVSARGANSEGPWSPWFPVGDVPPDGRPRGSAKVGDH